MQITGSDYKLYSVRSALILTNSYVAGTVIGGNMGTNNVLTLNESDSLTLYIAFTKGSLTNAGIKIEFSDDGTTYYQEVLDDPDVTTGIITEFPASRIFTASGNYRIGPIKIKDQYIKISAIGTGTVTSSSMTISAIVGHE